MTINPAPRVFHLNNYTGRPREGTHLARAIVKGEKISIYTNMLTKSNTGKLFETMSNVVVYSTHVNDHGVKYLKVQKRVPQGDLEDVTVELMAYKEVLYYVQFLASSKALEKFLEKAISRWFKIPYSPNQLKEHPRILFPALTGNAEELRPLLKELRELDVVSLHDGRVPNALRTSADLSSALKSICGKTVQSETDISLLLHNPNLLHIADMKLGMTLSEFVASGGPIFPDWINRPTRQVLKFLLEHLPDTKRESILNILRDSKASPLLHAERSASREETYWGDACHYAISCVRLNLSKVQREVLAEELFQCFTLPLEKVLGRSPRERVLIGQLQRWMAENIVEPEVVSEATVEDVNAVFHELLMPDCAHGLDVSCEHGKAAKGIRFKIDQRGTTFCTVSDSYALTPIGEENYTDLASNLVLLAGRSNGRILHIKLGGHVYVTSDGKQILLDGDIYTLDKIIELIRRGVKETDKQLARLGREITPQNRVAYLTFGTFAKEERKLKSTWLYYDLGVTEPSKIVALNEARITNPRDIEMYASLPDDMFYDFLKTASRKKQ